MPDRKPKPDRITPHKDKLCQTCGRAFSWRKKWERDWEAIRYCSDACRGHKPGEADRALEGAILELLAERGREKTICPSEAAKLVGGKDARRDWEGLMEPARAAARRLVAAGQDRHHAEGRGGGAEYGEGSDPAAASMTWWNSPLRRWNCREGGAPGFYKRASSRGGAICV